MKVVINKCYGGFGLSNEAMLRVGELKGMNLYPNEDTWRTTFWTVPLDQVPSTEDNAVYNKFYEDNTVWDQDFDRNDPDLVQVVEEMGDAASGSYASLRIVDVPDAVEWQIEEYDGFEHIAEKHRTWN